MSGDTGLCKRLEEGGVELVRMKSKEKASMDGEDVVCIASLDYKPTSSCSCVQSFIIGEVQTTRIGTNLNCEWDDHPASSTCSSKFSIASGVVGFQCIEKLPHLLCCSSYNAAMLQCASNFLAPSDL